MSFGLDWDAEALVVEDEGGWGRLVRESISLLVLLRRVSVKSPGKRYVWSARVRLRSLVGAWMTS